MKAFETHQKVTIGFVTQIYTTLPNGSMVCTDQQFHAGEVDYTDMNGENLDLSKIDTDKEVYCPMDMKQPKQIPGFEQPDPFHDRPTQHWRCRRCDERLLFRTTTIGHCRTNQAGTRIAIDKTNGRELAGSSQDPHAGTSVQSQRSTDERCRNDRDID